MLIWIPNLQFLEIHDSGNHEFTPSILRSICFVIFYRLSRLIGGFSNGQETNL